MLPSSSSQTEGTVQKIRCPLGDVTSEAWGHETATGENRRALAQAGRWVSSVPDTALAGEVAWVVAVDLQDPRDYQMPVIDERKSHRGSGSAREPANNGPTLSEPYSAWCNLVATLIFLKRKGFTVPALPK